MTVEKGLKIIEQVLPQGQLSKVQEVVFRRSWESQSYKEIAEQFDYAAENLLNLFWQLHSELSDAEYTLSDRAFSNLTVRKAYLA